VKRGELKSVRIGARRLFRRADLEHYVANLAIDVPPVRRAGGASAHDADVAPQANKVGA